MFDSKFNKIVRGVNGVGILCVLLFRLVEFVIDDIVPNLSFLFEKEIERGVIIGTGAEKAQELNLSIQHVMYERPQRIGNTDYYLSEIIILDKNLPEDVKNAMAQANDITIQLIGTTLTGELKNEMRNLPKRRNLSKSYHNSP